MYIHQFAFLCIIYVIGANALLILVSWKCGVVFWERSVCMSNISLSLNLQTALILCVVWPQMLHQSSKHVPCIAWWFAKRDFEISDSTALQVTPTAKSHRQMCRGCRVGVAFLAFFGFF